MVQATTTDQPKSLQAQKTGEDSMIDFSDWLKAEAEAEANTALAEKSTKKLSKREFKELEATAIVTGRPTKKFPIDGKTVLSSAELLTPVEVDFCGKNWVGQLVEYRQANANNTGPIYQESSPGFDLYTCIVNIGEQPSSPIGDLKAIFTRKKDAKNYAAKLAIEWLIKNEYMPADGTVSFPKARSHPAVPPPKAASSSSSFLPSTLILPLRPRLVSVPGSADQDLKNSTTTTASDAPPPLPPAKKVATLCAKLAISPPTYVLTSDAGLSAVYSGHALFINRSAGLVGAGLDGPVGEVRNVFGKKRTREACAEKVVDLLEALVEKRAEKAKLLAVKGTEGVPAEEEVVKWQWERSLLD